MNKKQRNKYNKEVKDILEKYTKLLSHHIGSVFLRFANDVYKLNAKYFELK